MTDKNGLTSYSYEKVVGSKSDKPRKVRITIDETIHYAAVDIWVNSSMNHVKLIPKQQKQNLVVIIFADSISKKIVPIHAVILRNGYPIGTFYGLSVNLGSIKLTTDMASKGDSITIQANDTGSYQAVRHTFIISTNSVTVPLARVIRQQQISLGFEVYNSTLYRVPFA
jgi:hypothetical protein